MRSFVTAAAALGKLLGLSFKNLPILLFFAMLGAFLWGITHLIKDQTERLRVVRLGQSAMSVAVLVYPETFSYRFTTEQGYEVEVYTVGGHINARTIPALVPLPLLFSKRQWPLQVRPATARERYVWRQLFAKPQSLTSYRAPDG